MSREDFGTLTDGTPVSLWTLAAGDVRLRFIDYGAAIVSVEVPDRDGRIADVVLGFDTLEQYVAHRGCFGAVVGRFANRIAHGRFDLDGRVYQLATGPGGHHLHGGRNGFDKVVWNGEEMAGGRRVRFSRVSPDGEEHYPGACSVSVTYTLTEDRALTIDYAATTDAPTPLNLSQHTYFNLAGHDGAPPLGHRLTLYASRFTPVNAALIPTGDIRSVDGSPFDFRTARSIGFRIDGDDEQLRLAGGYDHNFVIDREGEGLAAVAQVVDPVSGRTLDVRSTEPGVQFYTGNMLDGSQVGKGGHVYGRRSGFCLETQHFPNSPNEPGFPDTILRPGTEFRSSTVFTFGTQ